jgi:L-threonylcarbamoyladenylate synthase
MNTLILDGADANSISTASSLLQAGNLVAVPTETVYGLAADARHLDAVRMVFTVKNRPVGHPLIMHFSKVEEILPWALDVPDTLFKLASHFWPGPLSVLLNKSDMVSDEITGGSKKVCVRIPNHQLTLSIIKELGAPIVAPSANSFGGISPTRAEHVLADMRGKIAAVVDGGQCDVGIESTILDLTTDIPTLLRPGGYSVIELEEKLGFEISLKNVVGTKISGNLVNHYQPKTTLVKMSYEQILDHHKDSAFGNDTILIHHSTFENLNVRMHLMPNDPVAYGKDLYAVLRELDQLAFDTIYIETPPQNFEWLAIEDRILKASHK